MSEEATEKSTSLSRRNVIRTASVLGGVAVGSAVVPGAAHAHAAVPGRKTPGATVLALIGDRYHNLDYIRTHLIKFFGDTNVKFDYTANWEWFGSKKDTAAMLDGYKVFLVFRDGIIIPGGYVGPDAYPNITGQMVAPPNGPQETWVTEGFGEAVKSYVEKGGSLFAAHNSGHISLKSTNFRDVVKGAYDGHPTERPFQVRVINGNHPVTQGVKAFGVTDEQHFPLYDGGSTLLTEGINIDGLPYTTNSGLKPATSATTWAHTFGRGKVVHHTIGHNLDALWKPDNLLIWRNTMNWLTH
ncbi:hypothetical protein GCM10022251_32340 [Phytohabitans flavus]|uniref:ThuA-like domain-containing protein n=1 Tax=Phytohabitans flavus TaxID=1076124 RepID=A0A6F8XWE7_9ACTN|nr:ThuA domain-containing protein [Phytohabitans flavus]BCB78155.1 hypothetical protein Pflav_045650 [Phytohabitans flavus]